MKRGRYMTQSPGRVVLGVVLVTMFVSTLFFGFTHISNMQSMADETGCPFSLVGGSSVCPTEVGDHLALWQNLFLAAPLVLFLLLVLTPLVRAIVAACSQLFSQVVSVWKLMPKFFYTRQVLYIPISSHLEESFSKGILHTKRF